MDSSKVISFADAKRKRSEPEALTNKGAEYG